MWVAMLAMKTMEPWIGVGVFGVAFAESISCLWVWIMALAQAWATRKEPVNCFRCRYFISTVVKWWLQQLTLTANVLERFSSDVVRNGSSLTIPAVLMLFFLWSAARIYQLDTNEQRNERKLKKISSYLISTLPNSRMILSTTPVTCSRLVTSVL